MKETKKRWKTWKYMPLSTTIWGIIHR